MSILTSSRKGLLNTLWTPAVEQLRFRNRPNLKNPLPPHYKRARMLAVCEPQYKIEPKVCQKYAEEQKRHESILENPYGAFLVRSMRKDFYAHPMIAIYHTNSFIMHQYLHIRGMLFDSKFEMDLKLRQNAKVMTEALRGTKFEPAIPLMSAHVTIGLCKTPNVSKLIKVSKKMPAFVLIGVIVDDRLLNKAEFEYYAGTNIETVRSQLSHTLSSAGGGTLSSLLTRNSLALSQSLASHAASNSDNSVNPESVSESPRSEQNEKPSPVTPE